MSDFLQGRARVSLHFFFSLNFCVFFLNVEDFVPFVRSRAHSSVLCCFYDKHCAGYTFLTCLNNSAIATGLVNLSSLGCADTDGSVTIHNSLCVLTQLCFI